MESQKNIYGLSEGVFKACQLLGLKFPAEISGDPRQEHFPSDYFGGNLELDPENLEKLRSKTNLTEKQFNKTYKSFSEKYSSQKNFKHNKTDLSVYFCDLLFFSAGQTGASISDYFDFEFYKKSAAERKTFLTQDYRNYTLKTCSEIFSNLLPIENKPKTNKFLADFLHRDWLDTRSCTIDEFKLFAEKHPRFFSKPFNGSFGKGAEIISVDSGKNLEELFANLQSKKHILEAIVNQHESIKEFCPDTLNTIRVNTFLDVHNVVHILTTGGRFGRVGNVVDNFHGGGFSTIIDPKTGIIISDAINKAHERVDKHPDTGKVFKGFQYPAWENLRATVIKMAKLLPRIPHIGWDIAIDDKGETILIEANNNPDVDVQQAPDSVGRIYLYKDLVDEWKNYNDMKVRILGYRVNEIHNFNSAYESQALRNNSKLKVALEKLIPDCASLMDLGCRKAKLVKSLCPEGVKYVPVDFQKYDDEVITCNFDDGDFPNITADTCLSAFTAEYVKLLPEFLANMCNAAQRQILMWCRPFDKELAPFYRWRYPFSTDFTEKFLIETMNRNNFRLDANYGVKGNHSLVLYDFRKIR